MLRMMSIQQHMIIRSKMAKHKCNDCGENANKKGSDENWYCQDCWDGVEKTQPDDRENQLCKLAEEIYTELGYGHLESIYHNAMKVGLHDLNLSYETERDLPVTFRGRYVGTVRADLVVEGSLVIELKISGKMEDATDQCKQYMKLTGIERGLVLMFDKNGAGVKAQLVRL